MTAFEPAGKLTALFVHRKDKCYLRSVVTMDDGMEEVKYTIYKSKDGINDELVSDGIFSHHLLPQHISNIYQASVDLTN